MRKVLGVFGGRGSLVAVSMISTSQGSSVSSRKRLSQGMRGREDVVAAGVGGDDHAVAGEAGEGLADDRAGDVELG